MWSKHQRQQNIRGRREKGSQNATKSIEKYKVGKQHQAASSESSRSLSGWVMSTDLRGYLLMIYVGGEPGLDKCQLPSFAFLHTGFFVATFCFAVCGSGKFSYPSGFLRFYILGWLMSHLWAFHNALGAGETTTVLTADGQTYSVHSNSTKHYITWSTSGIQLWMPSCLLELPHSWYPQQWTSW